ncbi:MAG: histidinol-phosphate aminotransferase family protein, partial [Desulfobacteraceae bacterium]
MQTNLMEIEKTIQPRPLSLYDRLPVYESMSGREQFLCMDANEGPPADMVFLERVLMLSAAKAVRYPEYDDLKQAAGAAYGIEPEAVMPLNGADEGIRLVLQAFCQKGSRVTGSFPGFSMYPIYTQMTGADFQPIPSLITFSADINGLVAASKKADMLVLASPNNPTGQRILPLELRKLLEAAKEIPFLLDETYAAFCRQNFIPLLEQYPNLLILRTLSKAHGVPGLRCGFLLGDPALIRSLEPLRSPYNVSAIAAAAGSLILREDRAYQARCRQAVRVAQGLRVKLLEAGVQAYHTDTHFFLIQMRPGEEMEVAAWLKANGILVRIMGATLPGILRVSVTVQ